MHNIILGAGIAGLSAAYTLKQNGIDSQIMESRNSYGGLLDSIHFNGSRLLFVGNLTKKTYIKDIEYRVVGELVQTDKTMNDTFWIGVQPALTNDHLDFVVEKMEEFFGFNF